MGDEIRQVPPHEFWSDDMRQAMQQAADFAAALKPYLDDLRDSIRAALPTLARYTEYGAAVEFERQYARQRARKQRRVKARQ